jgi:hypothetical protein
VTTDERIAEVLSKGTVRVDSRTAGTFVDPQVTVTHNGTEYIFRLAGDRWRLTHLSTYGNLTGAVCINGGSVLTRSCCDGSGHRVNVPNALVLNHIVNDSEAGTR